VLVQLSESGEHEDGRPRGLYTMASSPPSPVRGQSLTLGLTPSLGSIRIHLLPDPACELQSDF